MSAGWVCPFCEVPLTRKNASLLRSGAVVHIGCPKNDAALQAAVGPIREAFGVDPGLPVGPGDPDITPEARPRSRGRKPAPPPAPLVQASGPQDHEALGRERYHDTPEADRAVQIPRILELTKAGTPEADRRFADGWMAEHARVTRRPVGSEIDLRSPPAPKERRRISLRGADALPGLPFAGIGGPVAVVTAIAPAPKLDEERHAAEMKAWLDPKGDQGGPVPWLRTDEALRIYSAAGGGEAGVRALCAKIDDGSWSVGRCEGCGVLLAECACPVKAARLRREKLPPDPHPVPQLAHDPDAWDPAGPLGDGVIYSKREGLKGILAFLAWILRLYDAETAVHMLVPGFPGHACCGVSIEVPTQEAGKPPASGPRFATTRKLATCAECLEIYDDAEALAGRCEDLRGEEDPADPEEEEDGEEDLEAYFRKLRDKRQIAMLNDVPAQHHGPRADGELIHIFDGFPEVRASGDRVETRCGLSVSVPDTFGGIYSMELVLVPYLHGHLLSCPRCGELPAPYGSRSFGAFVPPDRIGKPAVRQGPIVEYAPRQKAKRGRGRSR